MLTLFGRGTALGVAALILLAALAYGSRHGLAQTPDYGYGAPPPATFNSQQQPEPRTKTVTPGSQIESPMSSPGDQLQLGKSLDDAPRTLDEWLKPRSGHGG